MPAILYIAGEGIVLMTLALLASTRIAPITGGIVAPIYVSARDKTFTFVLYKRQKGPVGQKLKSLLYIKKLELR